MVDTVESATPRIKGQAALKHESNTQAGSDLRCGPVDWIDRVQTSSRASRDCVEGPARAEFHAPDERTDAVVANKADHSVAGIDSAETPGAIGGVKNDAEVGAGATARGSKVTSRTDISVVFIRSSFRAACRPEAGVSVHAWPTCPVAWATPTMGSRLPGPADSRQARARQAGPSRAGPRQAVRRQMSPLFRRPLHHCARTDLLQAQAAGESGRIGTDIQEALE